MQTIAVYWRNELKKLKIALYFAVKTSIICFGRKIVYCLTTDIRRIRLKGKKIPEVGNLEKARLRKKKSERCHHFRRK